MYAKFRTVASILVIAEFTIPLLAMMALKKLVDEPEVLTTRIKYVYASLGLTAGFCLLFALMPSVFFPDFISVQETQALQQLPAEYQGPLMSNLIEIRKGIFTSDCWRSFWIILIGFGFLMLYKMKKLNSSTNYLLKVKSLQYMVFTTIMNKHVVIIKTYYFDSNGYLANEYNYYDKLEWSISDDDFINTATMSKSQFVAILNRHNISKSDAELIFDRCTNFMHNPTTIYSDASQQYGKEYKQLLRKWMTDNGYDKRIGINPEILLSTWKWENGYQHGNCFGIRGGTDKPFDEQVDSCIVNYLNKYYFALYKRNINNDELIAYINDGQATFNPCNSAMYSRCIYNTDNFNTWKLWHDTISSKKW